MTKYKVFDVIQQFISDVYNVPGILNVDAARLQLFIYMYTVSDVNEKFQRKSVRNFDSCNLPLCKSELLQQFCRANYGIMPIHKIYLIIMGGHWMRTNINLTGSMAISCQVLSVNYSKLNQKIQIIQRMKVACETNDDEDEDSIE